MGRARSSRVDPCQEDPPCIRTHSPCPLPPAPQANKDRLKVAASVGPPKPPYKSAFLGRLMGDTREKDEYRELVLATSRRERGRARDQYVQGVIDAAVGFSAEEKA